MIILEVLALGVWVRIAFYLLKMGRIEAIDGSLMIIYAVAYILCRIYMMIKNKRSLVPVQILEEETH